MAEAFGIAGSAFGTISLGLQLFKEISQYLDDIDGREEDLKEARSYATNIQLSLNALNVAISTAPTDDPETKRAIESCKASCVSAVDNLLAVVKELRGPVISVPSSNAARAKELCAKLKYPFKKQTMEKFEDSLSRTNSSLQTMLQVFQLNTGFAATSSINNMHRAVADLHVISGKNKATLDRMHKTSQVHDNRLSTIQQDIRELLTLTRDSGDSKLLLRTMAQQVSDLTSRNNIDINLPQNSAPDEFLPSIRTTNYQGGGSDVNEDGETILGSALEKYRMPSGQSPLTSDNMAELFQMLALITEPTSCARRITAEPIPALIATSSWFPTCTRPEQIAMTILSKCKEPVGHHYDDWGLSWLRDEERVGDGYRLFQAFPQVVENFGPLSQAVLEQDRNTVQQLLERFPSYITETNYCGQSPVHLAIGTQNIAVITVVLQYADARALRARDNGGFYPIDYLTERTWKHNGELQADCEGCIVLGMLLRLDTALFPALLRVALKSIWYDSHSCIHGRKIIMKGLAQRRQALKELSYRWLSPVEREDLEIYQTRMLDHNAARVQHKLEARGCPIPAYLSVYEEDIVSSHDHESIYSLISNGEVAEYAHQLGFHYSDTEFAHFICSIAFRMIVDTEYETLTSHHQFPSSYFCWMIDHGTSVSSRIPTELLPSQEIDVTAAHYFMASLGRSARLGLRHVCCSIVERASGPLPEDETHEIEEEDSPILDLFEALLKEFEDGRPHNMSLERFFEWMRSHWSPRMQQARKDLASEKLTDEQLRDAESIGVVWEVNGPRPESESWQPAKRKISGLWDAMDELDKIATDPERPTKDSLKAHA
ncbi:hypothetical protein FPRO03_10240 [Fusarium proliferatum]|nr:hypothetical protein FPRO03_10240 [Fusarium proliferatum]